MSHVQTNDAETVFGLRAERFDMVTGRESGSVVFENVSLNPKVVAKNTNPVK